ncbi:hypothetical protein C8Q73DRAFT_737327, partial [Cubamyces lactineus]
MSQKRRLSDALNEAGSHRPSTPESQLIADVVALSLQASPDSQVGSEGPEVCHVLQVAKIERMKRLSSLPSEHFIRGWFQVARAHYHNWRNGVQHRAISLDNLMCRGEDGDLFCAVLNDWDLGIDAKDANLTHTGLAVTGTVPFMAIDLLTQEALDGKVAVLYRHDLEAFIWVLVWAVCCYDNGKMVYTVPRGIYNWDVRKPL